MKNFVAACARLRPHALAVLASVVLAANLAILLDAAVGMLRQLVFTGATWPWVDTHVLGPRSAIAWQSAILLSGAIAWAVSQPWSRSVRVRAGFSILAAFLGVVLIYAVTLRPTLYELGLSEVDYETKGPIPWAFVALFALGIASTGWLARRPAPEAQHSGVRAIAHGGKRRVAAALLLGALLQAPSIAEWVEEHRTQSFPDFRLELVAAELLPDERPGAVWSDGAWWALDRGDMLVIDDGSVERVRWTDDPDNRRPGFTIRFDPATAAAVRDRSIRRVDLFDALVVDGRVQMVPRMQSQLLDGSFALHVPIEDRDHVAELFTRLTGTSAPLR